MTLSFPPTAAAGRVWVVDQRHPAASDKNQATADQPLRTIKAAAFRAHPGDTVRVHAGVYRERVAPRRGGNAEAPIVYEAAAGEHVVITALEVWRPTWQAVPNAPALRYGALDPSVFAIHDPQSADWDTFPASYSPYQIPLNSAPGGGESVDPYGRVTADEGRQAQTVGQLFLEGEPLVQVASRGELHHVPGSWMVADGGEGLYVHFPPGRVPLEQWRLEISARSRCFAPYRRGLGHIHVRGFTMIGGASDFPRGFYKEGKSPQVGVMGTRAGHHWVIEHNVIRYGKSLGLDIGLEGKSDADGLGQPEPDIPEDNGTSGRHIVRHNVISDHGAGGIAGLKAYGSVITDNVIERNNRLGFTAPEIGGIKLHFFGDGLIARNLVRDNHCYGVWLDNMYHRARVTRNAIVNNQGSGVFIELGHGPVLIDHNVIALTRPLAQQPGDGLYSHDASGVTFAHNLVLFNAHFGLWAHVATDRQPRRYQDGRRGERSPAEASGWTVVNNLFIGNTAGALGLPPEADRAHGNRVDHNLYAGTYPRSTVETFGAMLGATTFRLNTNKGRLPGEAVDLNLEAWRQRTGWDQHSHFLPVLRPQLATGTMRLLLTAGPPLDLEATPVDGTDVDYFGYPLGTHPRVGPFQSLAVEKALRASAETPDSVAPFVDLGTGHQNHLLLWPLRPSPPEASSGDAGTQKE